MDFQNVYTNEFWDNFTGSLILEKHIKQKILRKHKVYERDLEDAFGDPGMVVIRNKRKSKASFKSPDSKGVLYELYAETENRKVMFIIGRLFPDGNLYIITAYWANKEQTSFYYKESEV